MFKKFKIAPYNKYLAIEKVFICKRAAEKW